MRMRLNRLILTLILVFLNAKITLAELDQTANRTRINWIGHWYREDLRESLVRDIAREYRFLYPDNEINLKFPEEILGSRNKEAAAKLIVNMILKNEFSWDIVWLDNQIYRYVAEVLEDWGWGKKHLVNFREIPGFAKTQKPFILSNPEYSNQTGDIIVGPYLESFYMTLWYNKNVAKLMGLKIKQRGMLFEDLLSYVRTVALYNQAHNTSIAAFYEAKNWTSMEHLFQNLVKSAIFNFEHSKSISASRIKDSALLKTLSAFEKLGEFRPLIKTHNQNSWFETRHLPLEDNILFCVNGTWMYGHWRGIDREKVKKMVPTELPVFQPVDFALGGYIPTWAVMKKSPNRDAAIRLLLWLSQNRIAEKWVRDTKNPTGLKGNLSQVEFGGDAFERFNSDMTRMYKGRVHFSTNPAYVLGSNGVELGKILETILIQLLSGETNVQEAYVHLLKLRDR